MLLAIVNVNGLEGKHETYLICTRWPMHTAAGMWISQRLYQLKKKITVVSR